MFFFFWKSDMQSRLNADLKLPFLGEIRVSKRYSLETNLTCPEFPDVFQKSKV